MEINLLQTIDSKGRNNTKTRGNKAYFNSERHKTNVYQLTTSVSGSANLLQQEVSLNDYWIC